MRCDDSRRRIVDVYLFTITTHTYEHTQTHSNEFIMCLYAKPETPVPQPQQNSRHCNGTIGTSTPHSANIRTDVHTRSIYVTAIIFIVQCMRACVCAFRMCLISVCAVGDDVFKEYHDDDVFFGLVLGFGGRQ